MLRTCFHRPLTLREPLLETGGRESHQGDCCEKRGTNDATSDRREVIEETCRWLFEPGHRDRERRRGCAYRPARGPGCSPRRFLLPWAAASGAAVLPGRPGSSSPTVRKSLLLRVDGQGSARTVESPGRAPPGPDSGVARRRIDEERWQHRGVTGDHHPSPLTEARRLTIRGAWDQRDREEDPRIHTSTVR